MSSTPHPGTAHSWRRLHRSPLADTVQFVLLLLLCGWFFSMSLGESGYNWQWYQVPQYLFTLDGRGFHAGPLLQGLGHRADIRRQSYFRFYHRSGHIAAAFQIFYRQRSEKKIPYHLKREHP